MWALLSTIFGGIVSIGTAIFVEYFRRPSIVLSNEDPVDLPPLAVKPALIVTDE